MILALTSETLTPRPDLRRRLDVLQQKLSQVDGRRPGDDRRQLAAGGARRAQPARAQQIRHRRSRTCAPRSPPPTPTAPRARSRTATALPDLHQRPGERGRRLPRRSSSPIATARRCGCPTSPRSSIRSRTSATLGLFNGKPAVLVIVYRQPGANIIETVDRVKALLPRAAARRCPATSTSTWRCDRTTTIRASLHDVERTLIIAIVLVILVVFALPAQRAGDARSRASPCRSR